jgi:nitronate monooxygenase
MTRPLRKAAAKQNRAEFLSLWAGQGLTLARKESASALIARLVEEMDIALDQLQSARQKMNRAVSVDG